MLFMSWLIDPQAKAIIENDRKDYKSHKKQIENLFYEYLNGDRNGTNLLKRIEYEIRDTKDREYASLEYQKKYPAYTMLNATARSNRIDYLMFLLSFQGEIWRAEGKTQPVPADLSPLDIARETKKTLLWLADKNLIVFSNKNQYFKMLESYEKTELDLLTAITIGERNGEKSILYPQYNSDIEILKESVKIFLCENVKSKNGKGLQGSIRAAKHRAYKNHPKNRKSVQRVTTRYEK